jgi:uncharacterized protein (TIGR00255 family)
MINSMTGYGDAEGQFGGVTYAVEIRAVNNRYFKAKMKLPDPVAFLEEDIEKLMRKELSRGTVTYTLRLKDISASSLFSIDEAGLRAYIERLGKIASSVSVQCPIEIGSLLNLPGILTPVVPDEETAMQVKKVVLDITRCAIEGLKKMRAAEGAALSAELDGYCKAIKQDLEQIRARSSVVVQEYQKKLKKRVDSLLADAKLKLDAETLAREVAIYAERADISEEIARLDSHLQQFAQGGLENGQAGRRLDFLSQEMLREANTIGSKASDTEIIHWVVNIKCWIDRIKEQVQNIE